MSRDLDIGFRYTSKMATRRSKRKITLNKFYGFSDDETKRNETPTKPKRKRYSILVISELINYNVLP